MDEYSMYLCPKCQKVFKVKGNNKAVKCSQCSENLLDMSFSMEDWVKLGKEERAKVKKEHSTTLSSSIELVEESVSTNRENTEDKPKTGFFNRWIKIYPHLYQQLRVRNILNRSS